MWLLASQIYYEKDLTDTIIPKSSYKMIRLMGIIRRSIFRLSNKTTDDEEKFRFYVFALLIEEWLR